MDSTQKPRNQDSGSNPWLVISIVLAIALVILISFTFTQKAKDANDPLGPVVISADEGASMLLDFINELYGPQLGAITLKDVKEDNGLYHVTLVVLEDGVPADQTIFITRDGKFFVPQLVEISTTLDEFRTFQQQQPPQGDQVILDPTLIETPPVE